MSTKIVKTERNLACTLTEKEVLKYSKELSQMLSTKNAQESELANFQKQAKAKISQTEGRIGELSEKVYSEKEFREINCEWRYDFAIGTKQLFRTDNGELIDTEIIAEYEKQEEMSIPQSEQAPAEPTPEPA